MPKGTGTRLGSRFVDAFVRGLGGTLATGTGPKGTTFTVRLPASILAERGSYDAAFVRIGESLDFPDALADFANTFGAVIQVPKKNESARGIEARRRLFFNQRE